MFLQVGVAHGRIEELSGRDLKIVTDGEEFCQGGQRFTGADSPGQQRRILGVRGSNGQL